MNYWWGNPREFTPRMWAEVAAMKAAFDVTKTSGVLIETRVYWDDNFYLSTHLLKLNISSNPMQPFWTVIFSMRETDKKSKSRSTDKFTLQIEYPESYPSSEPHVTIPSHKLGTMLANHIFPGGVLCLHNHSSSRTGWDPSSSTAATFGLWSVEWVRAWQRSKRTGKWPDEA